MSLKAHIIIITLFLFQLSNSEIQSIDTTAFFNTAINECPSQNNLLIKCYNTLLTNHRDSHFYFTLENQIVEKILIQPSLNILDKFCPSNYIQDTTNINRLWDAWCKLKIDKISSSTKYDSINDIYRLCSDYNDILKLKIPSDTNMQGNFFEYTSFSLNSPDSKQRYIAYVGWHGVICQGMVESKDQISAKYLCKSKHYSYNDETTSDSIFPASNKFLHKEYTTSGTPGFNYNGMKYPNTFRRYLSRKIDIQDGRGIETEYYNESKKILNQYILRNGVRDVQTFREGLKLKTPSSEINPNVLTISISDTIFGKSTRLNSTDWFLKFTIYPENNISYKLLSISIMIDNLFWFPEDILRLRSGSIGDIIVAGKHIDKHDNGIPVEYFEKYINSGKYFSFWIYNMKDWNNKEVKFTIKYMDAYGHDHTHKVSSYFYSPK